MSSIRVHEHLVLHKLWWIGPLAITMAVVANSVIRSIAVVFFGISETFSYLQIPSVIGSTVVFLLLALLVFVVVCHVARRPIQFYRLLALVVLCISLLSPVMALVGVFPAPGMNLSVFWTMVTMHIVSAAIAVGMFTTLVRSNKGQKVEMDAPF